MAEQDDTLHANRKRYRPDPPVAEDVLRKARQIWRRANKERAVSTEEHEFRTFFGVSVEIFLTTWNLLEKKHYLPPDGTIEHMLWALMFMRVYASESVLCALAGGIDKNTFKKWTWPFIEAIEMLQLDIVSSQRLLYTYLIALTCYLLGSHDQTI